MSEPLYDPDLSTRVETDYSGFAIGAVLTQQHGVWWHPVAYLFRSVTAPEKNHPIQEQELLASICITSRSGDATSLSWRLQPTRITHHSPLEKETEIFQGWKPAGTKFFFSFPSNYLPLWTMEYPRWCNIEKARPRVSSCNCPAKSSGYNHNPWHESEGWIFKKHPQSFSCRFRRWTTT